MIANHIHDALGQVRRLQALILEKRKFTGYSGTARMMGGSIALLGTVMLSLYAGSQMLHLIGWGLILLFSLLLNYGALLLWYTQLPEAERTLRTLSPAFEAMPPLAVGAVLSLALIIKGQPDLLFGMWMCLYGLCHTCCRSILPKENGYLGYYYLICGAGFLLFPHVSFLSPWPAGLVFLIGEGYGGFIFHRHKLSAMENPCDE